MAFLTDSTACSKPLESSALTKSGLIIVDSVHLSSSSMKLDGFCLDMVCVPFGKRECFGGKQLALLTARQVEPPGPSRVIGAAPRRAVPCGGLPGGTLIRLGGGYNSKPVSKATQPVVVRSR